MSKILANKRIFHNGKITFQISAQRLLLIFNKQNYDKGRKYSSKSPIQVLEEKIAAKEMVADEHQIKAMRALDKLHKSLNGYVPTLNAGNQNGNGGGWFSVFEQKKKSKSSAINTNAPQGIYLYGGVGGGKTTIMDLFYGCCDMVQKKERIHYTTFMSKVHSRIHEAKQQMGGRSSGDSTPYDPTLPVANVIANESWLLCLDEFQVTDIADAMIFKRLFTHIFNNGVVLVATSNRAPDDLYKNGLQRSQFLPFIPILKSRCEIIAVDGGVDYRQLASKGTSESYYFVKTQDNVDKELDRIFKILCTQENDIVRPKTITHFGRDLTFAKTCGQVLDSTFSELCDRPLSGNDFIQVSQFFHTVIIRDVPRLTTLLKNQSRRFVTLVDTLYDNKIRVVISADSPIEDLFAISHEDELSDDHKILMDDLKIKHGSQDSTANVFTNSEEIFAIDRARSRLGEMQSKQYWQQAAKGR